MLIFCVQNFRTGKQQFCLKKMVNELKTENYCQDCRGKDTGGGHAGPTQLYKNSPIHGDPREGKNFGT
jgi:hypothetical protein